ncbi:MAG: 4-(cytidine 5'-diphospho)-2-C-methyl-D-erythritol kinase [Chlamydiae bacterium CG10_big_fil_rev_8_21_14_0_10_42_34]|nr:MAG: 4-(cytidine 5'-diphospho)-2-C-methyl-D-erythritol kinase [Chlamydiae bacterium CG10_big_fil_rev_8_21_14_0_10_42_34]
MKLRHQNKSFASPAKLNLFFRVLSKRPDGYHNIVSLFQAIDLFDRLFFSPSTKDIFTCTDPSIPTDDSNLINKALTLFKAHFPTPTLHIHLEKNIPVEAGLGGGSSNAATTLWALNELTNRPATLPELIEMGSKLGSDVPFFFSQGTALCRGRGEILDPYSIPPLSGYIAKPSYGLSTPAVYQNVRIDESSQTESPYFNDLEAPAFRLEPRLATLKAHLQKQFQNVIMTGSGTALFCLNGKPKPIQGVTFYPFHSICRSLSWYCS